MIIHMLKLGMAHEAYSYQFALLGKMILHHKCKKKCVMKYK